MTLSHKKIKSKLYQQLKLTAFCLPRKSQVTLFFQKPLRTFWRNQMNPIKFCMMSLILLNLTSCTSLYLEEFKEAYKNIFTSNKKNENLKNFFKADFFADELPYLHFDDHQGIFINRTSLGFTLEIQPPTGISEHLSRELDTIFEEILEEE